MMTSVVLVVLFCGLLARCSSAASIEEQLKLLTARLESVEAQLVSLERSCVLKEELERLVPRKEASSRGPAAPIDADAPMSCPCNSFNASIVSIGSAGLPAELVIGSPETGTVNGVNIVALDNGAVKKTGDQAIAGSLDVQALTMGGWTFAPAADGTLPI